MAVADPETLLEWLSMNEGDERDMQLKALEQLCMALMTDNVEQCFAMYQPSSFLTALCHIFVDESSPDSVLEVTARAITYYLDLSAACFKPILDVPGVLKAMCSRLTMTDMSSRTNQELAKQCCKVLEQMCTFTAKFVLQAGGLNSVLLFMNQVGSSVHKDTLYSAMVVISKLCTEMNPKDKSLPSCVESLSAMLKHEDNHVSEEALSCFVTLSDKFTRYGTDSAILDKHGLVNELLLRLSSVLPVTNVGSSVNTNFSTTEVKSPVSTVIRLLTSLSLGSRSITHNLVRSNLPDAIEKSLKSDERCCLETIHFVDLLLIILLKGHNAVSWRKIVRTNNNPLIPNIQLVHTISHADIIEYMRNDNNEAFIESIFSHDIDVNSVNVQGHTLLNLVSTFGTPKMIDYLCSNGANVNKGYKFSSLHYAAAFGKLENVKMLLKWGANPELIDGDGKTPLDRAREGLEEDYRQIAAILESPEMLMSLKNELVQSSVSEEREGDPEMAEIYLKRFLPVFCHTFHSTIIPSIRKLSFSLIMKMVHYIEPNWLVDICNSDHPNSFAPLLVQVQAAVLHNEEDDEGNLNALQTIYELLAKCQDPFLDQFARLRVFCKFQELICPENNEAKPVQDKIVQEIVRNQVYHWNSWWLCRGQKNLYIWNDYVVIELSNGSNGWFRYIMNDTLFSMYSTGNHDCLIEEIKMEFIETYLKAKLFLKTNNSSIPILSKPSTNVLEVGSWLLCSIMANELCFYNTKSQQQITTLTCQQNGFLFRPNGHYGTLKTLILAQRPLENSITSDFEVVKVTSSVPAHLESSAQKVRKQAQKIYDEFFKAAQAQPRDVVARLIEIVSSIDFAIHNKFSVENSCDKEHWTSDLSKVLSDLKVLLIENEGNISTYEIYSSGLVDVLLKLLNNNSPNVGEEFTEFDKNLGIDVFVKCFKERKSENSMETCASVLVQRLLSVLESIEKLPVHMYESTSAYPGLKILNGRLRFRVEKAERDTTFLDFTDRRFQMEPLTTIQQLEKYLLKYITIEWYEHERSTYNFVKTLIDKNNIPMNFNYDYDFDQNGILFWIGTNGNSEVWINPGEYNLVVVRSSNGIHMPFDTTDKILGKNPSRCYIIDDRNAWVSVDLGLWMIPTDYTLRYGSGLQNWLFQVSRDGIYWTTLDSHVNDTNLNEPGDSCTWHVQVNDTEEIQGWRHVRIRQNWRYASRVSYEVNLSGFEIYGTVTGVCEDLDETVSNAQASFEHQSARHSPQEPSMSHLSNSSLQIARNGSNMIPVTTNNSLALSNGTFNFDNGRNGSPESSSSENEQEVSSEGTENIVEFNLRRLPYKGLLDSNWAAANESHINAEIHINPNKRPLVWNDNHVLVRKCTALVPPFDSRTGSINMSQIFDLEVDPPENESPDNFTEDPDTNDESLRQSLLKLKLTLKCSYFPGVKNVEIGLNNPNWTIFHAIQKLAHLADFGNQEEKSKKIWEPVYTIVYEALTNNAEQFNPDNQWDSNLPIFSTRKLRNTGCSVDQILQLLQQLHNLSIDPLYSLLEPYSDDEVHNESEGEFMSSDIFISNQITYKLVQQLQDPLVLSSNTLPSWCERLNKFYSFLLPFEIRLLYLNCTAFGLARSIICLQFQYVANHSSPRSSNLLREEEEFLVDRLLHDRVHIPRGENILAWGKQLMRAHVHRGTILEVKFMHEEATGLGPTLEFYSLIAAELQRKDFCMWLCSDEGHSQYNWFEYGANKPPGYYVRRSRGLFPAPLPQESPYCDRAAKHFWFLGMILAKVLQDQLMIDLPLSLPFLKILSNSKLNECERVLDDSDLFDVDEGQAVFIKHLKKLILLKDKILKDPSLSSTEKSQKIVDLRIQCGETGNVTFEDLSLNMVYLPSSSCFPFKYINLVKNGHLQDVDINNVEKYVDSMTNLLLHSGIKRQMNAFKDGFCRVFSIEKLNAFTPLELRSMLCGELEPNWTREDLLNFIEPKLGLNKESPGFLRLVNVLVQMNPNERKSFLQFLTGCSSLPPGGLANLNPRFTVVRNVDGGAGSYPSVNICVHYLKLPDYPDEDTLRERLLTAMLEK